MSKESQDTGNIVFFEHVNFEITDLGAAIYFYVEALGGTRDPYERTGPLITWVNFGQQQFHLLTKENNTSGEVIQGHIGLIVPSLDATLKSLQAAQKKYGNYHNFAYKFTLSDTVAHVPSHFLSSASRYIEVKGPWGNTFKIYENSDKIKYRGGLGIPYVEFLCRKGAAIKIGEFYKRFVGAPYTHGEEGGAVFSKVVVGPKQLLIFRETDEKVEPTTYHICIYIADFSGTYEKFSKNNLLFTKHKFDDKCETIEDALSYSQFRFNQIVDPDNLTDELFIMEHEVRSLCHPFYMRPLVNKTGNVGIYCKQ